MFYRKSYLSISTDVRAYGGISVTQIGVVLASQARFVPCTFNPPQRFESKYRPVVGVSRQIELLKRSSTTRRVTGKPACWQNDSKNQIVILIEVARSHTRGSISEGRSA